MRAEQAFFEAVFAIITNQVTSPHNAALGPSDETQVPGQRQLIRMKLRLNFGYVAPSRRSEIH
jgi:hypothetical protein